MKNEQERMEKLLKQELEKNADKTMEEVKADKSLDNIVLPEGMDAGLAAKIQEFEAKRDAYEKLSDEDKEYIRIGREEKMRRADDGCGDDDGLKDIGGKKTVKFRKKRRTIFGLVAAVAVLVLAVGMTSIGGEPFIPQLFEQMLAGRKNVNINSNDSEDDSVLQAEDIKEDQVYQDIKDAFGFDAVELWYLPDGTEFLESSIDKDLQEAYVLYDYDGTIIEYRILASYRNKSLGYDIEDEMLEEYSLKSEKVLINVKHYRIIDNNQEVFMGQFKYKNVNYVIQGNVSKSEFNKILKNLKFF